MSHTTTATTYPARIQLQGTFSWSLQTLPLQVLIDSGADDNFIDNTTVNQAHIPTLPLPAPKEVFRSGWQTPRPIHTALPRYHSSCQAVIVKKFSYWSSPHLSPPQSQVSSCPERDAMELCIRDSIAAGLIRPSSSPVGAGFFFVGITIKTSTHYPSLTLLLSLCIRPLSSPSQI